MVAEARGLDPGAVEALATGQVFWAKQALEKGLVDELGDQERAIELAMEMGAVPRRLVHVRPRRGRLRRWLGSATDALLQGITIEVERRLQGRLWN
jgi:protease-4